MITEQIAVSTVSYNAMCNLLPVPVMNKCILAFLKVKYKLATFKM